MEARKSITNQKGQLIEVQLVEDNNYASTLQSYNFTVAHGELRRDISFKKE